MIKVLIQVLLLSLFTIVLAYPPTYSTTYQYGYGGGGHTSYHPRPSGGGYYPYYPEYKPYPSSGSGVIIGGVIGERGPYGGAVLAGGVLAKGSSNRYYY